MLCSYCKNPQFFPVSDSFPTLRSRKNLEKPEKFAVLTQPKSLENPRNPSEFREVSEELRGTEEERGLKEPNPAMWIFGG